MKWLPLLMLLVVATGCGPDPDDVRWVRDARIEPSSDVGVPRDLPPPVDMGGLEPWDTRGAGPLTGTFALEVILKAEAVIELESRQILRVELLQTGAYIRQRATLCELAFPSLQGIADLSIPPPLARLLRSHVVVSEGEFLSSSEPIGAAYAPTIEPIVVGATLDDPYVDEMPAESSDPRVSDDDEDGNPGVSIGVDVVVCDQPELMFVALRLFNELSGTVEDLDTIAGDVTPQLDQVAFGVSHECAAPAASIEVKLIEGSSFRAVRVVDDDTNGDGSVSCDEIAAAAPRLFGDFWASE